MKPIIFSAYILLVLGGSLSFGKCYAQQQHFIYLQSENKQPFYIKIDNKVFSSTSSGYAIVSKLSKGQTQMQVGFPKNEFPPQTLNIDVADNAGYILKNFVEDGWGIMNLQTMQVSYSNGKPGKNSTAENTKLAVNSVKNKVDDNLNQQQEGSVQNTMLIPADNAIPEKKDRKAAVSGKPLNENVVSASAYVITKTKEENKPTGYVAVYKIKGTGSVEYVDVVIEIEPGSGNESSAKKQVAEKNVEQSVSSKIENKQTGNEKFLEIELPNPNSSRENGNVTNGEESNESPAEPVNAASELRFNSDCAAEAVDDDFFSVRKLMAAKRTDTGMREVALKAFRKKCFSAVQIKGLGVLMSSEESLLTFFQQAYPFVKDPQNYKDLEGGLSNPENKAKFRSFLNK